MVGFVLDREINDQIIQSGGGVSQNSFPNNLKIWKFFPTVVEYSLEDKALTIL